MEPNEISYAELKDLVSAVRFLAYLEFKKQEEFNWKLFVYQKFIEAYSLGKYEYLFEQMEGTNLITVVKELVG